MANTQNHSDEELDSEHKMLNEGKTGGEDRKSFQVDESLISCGVGPCKPNCAQKFATIQIFTANVFIINLIYIAFYAYLLGVMRTIEKRFGFQSVKTGGIISTADITTTCLVIFVGYIGDRATNPEYSA